MDSGHDMLYNYYVSHPVCHCGSCSAHALCIRCMPCIGNPFQQHCAVVSEGLQVVPQRPGWQLLPYPAVKPFKAVVCDAEV